MSFYSKYKDVVVIVLLMLFLFKGCQSCQRSNQIEWNKSNYELVKDSLIVELDRKDSIINSMNDSIKIYNLILQGEKDKNRILKEINKNPQENTRALIRTNKHLISDEKFN